MNNKSEQHSPQCYDYAHCDCLEDLDVEQYILDIVSQWFPGYTETNPQYRVRYIGIDGQSRIFRIETMGYELVKYIGVDVEIIEYDENMKEVEGNGLFSVG